ncbi:hypothetical protein [Flavobacterium sp.]|uniref:hypothetical protein n=1 Tax=Flavobacterium sp. TaxID=239 RepID=UPI0031E0C297
MIEKRKKRKKLFYVPGMISLVLIPLFCLYHFYRVEAFKVYHSIDISLPDSNQKKALLVIKRNYHVFVLNNTEDLEKTKLNDLQLALRKMKREHDTINGIKIHLGNEMSYEVYIKVLDFFAIEKMPIFIQNDNDFLVFMMPKPKPKKDLKRIVAFKCSYEEVNREYFLEQARKRKLQHDLALYKKNWILFFAYFGIVVLNIFALVKFNKNQNYNQK